MLIKISNFGPISYFEFDTSKNLTMIVGENNIGKSYALTLLYLILKRISEAGLSTHGIYDLEQRFSIGMLWDGKATSGMTNGMSNVKKLIESKPLEDSWNITEIVTADLVRLVSSALAAPLTTALQGTYGDLSNLVNRFSKESPEIILSGAGVSVRMIVTDVRVDVASVRWEAGQIIIKKSKTERQPKISKNGDYIVYYPEKNRDLLDSRFYPGLLFSMFYSIPRDLGSDVSHVHYLPASRSGLYQALSAFGVIIAELSKSRSFLSRKIELPGISEPLSDYFINLSEAKPVSKKMADNKYSLFASKIEDEVIKGKIEIDSKSKKLIYRPNGVDLRLDLSSTSSMASEIGPIVTYLRHVLPDFDSRKFRSRTRNNIANEKQVIFIEEPEAHLHPEVQVKFIKIISDLTKETGTRIIFTSHSNYIFNKISNEIISGDIDLTSFRALLFKATADGTVAEELDTDLYGIDDENFADIGETLYMERMELIERMNANQKKEK